MKPESTLRDDRTKASGGGRGRSAKLEDRYQPYRRASRKRRRGQRPDGLSEGPRPAVGPGVRLYWIPPSTAPARRLRRLFLLVTLLAVTAWGAMSVRVGDVDLGELGDATKEQLAALSPLIAEGREAVLALRHRLPWLASRSEPTGPSPVAAARVPEGEADTAPAAPVDAHPLPAEATDPPPVSPTAGHAAIRDGLTDDTPTGDVNTDDASSSEPAATVSDPAEAPVSSITVPPPQTSPLSVTPEPTPAPGTLFLQTYPWGRVYIDGVYAGDTPLVGSEIAAGVHTIRVERAGYESYVDYVLVEPARPVRLTGVTLTRALP